MRRFGLLFVLLGLLGLLAVTSSVKAQDFDRHPHLLLQKLEIVEINGVPSVVGIKGCVDLAGNQSVPLHAHHERLHFGSSGVSFGGESGHAVIPAAPFPSPFGPAVPWSNCEEFMSFFFP